MAHGRTGGHALHGVDVEQLPQEVSGRHAQLVGDLDKEGCVELSVG